jgi:hypothetical protein
MPKYLSFDATKDIRDRMLNRTLDPVYGRSPSPKTFKSDDYSIQTLGDSPNLLLPQVDDNRKNDLLVPQKSNIFKPTEYFIKETIADLPRRANLNLYPYFVKTDENLISIMATRSYDTESELFKFAAHNIRTNSNGPVLARINQNLYTATVAKNKIGEALLGNTNTLINIIRGKQPLIEGNEKITASSSIIGKGIDFLGTVAGTQLPFSTIPGDYLTNPRAPINVRPTDVSTGTKVWQDLTGVLGSIVGIQRRPLPTRKPSDILIENMGDATKYRLFDLLSFNAYAPNYTTGARSQMSTGLGRIPSMVAQGVKSILGVEAPAGAAYIGDDRANNVKNATTDLFSGRPIRSSYYLSLMFDTIAAELFHSNKNITQGGKIGGKLTWVSKNTTTKGINFQNVNDDLSTKYKFRPDSILEVTQQILDSKPQNGGDALAHIGHVIDQTSRYFKDGDTLISRGSGVKYIDNSGRDIGVEYARVWTKDRPYFNYGNTMPFYKETEDKPYYKGGETPFRRKGIRRFDGSVMSDTWNLNMAPMSDGTTNPEFPGSTNIVRGEKNFYAKKYMLSIENLAWGSSTLPGYTVNDLPFSERGPNGGRVMWFPPYDLKVSEQNSAKWESNTFLGRPEPIYTYQNTERSGTLNFKIVVDHPSIMNLLVREHFKNLNDEQADDYINSFFAGAKDIDFYSLIRTYANLNEDDITAIQNYLNTNKNPNDINRLKDAVPTIVENNPEGSSTNDANKKNESLKVKLIFSNSKPFSDSGTSFKSIQNYNDIFQGFSGTTNQQTALARLETALINIISQNKKTDLVNVFGKDNISGPESTQSIQNVKDDLLKVFENQETNFNSFKTAIEKLKTNIENKNINSDIVILIGSTTSGTGDDNSDYNLSMRRSHSIVKYVIETLKSNVKDKWEFKNVTSKEFSPGFEVFPIEVNYTLNLDLGFDGLDKSIIFRTINYGKQKNVDNVDCGKVIYTETNLNKFSPLSYGCRQSTVSIDYDTKTNVDGPSNVSSIRMSPTGNVSTNKTKPPIDLMKRIIMKTLSEEFYFKKLEETSPMIYSSLKEKLRYFHPGFHSMTPEGLNSRLTFLQQCLRPGNTIPIKGSSDDSDINARNTTFGPPPVCVLRVGDFYNSKVVIRDLNIQFEENVWDLNSEGIGIQPMIATVTIQLNFLGGHGLERPIERLQNALSSNFYANTEMYDERSESTNTKIGGMDANEFTKEFIQGLNDKLFPPTLLKDSSDKNNVSEGQYIGALIDDSALDYTTVIDNLYKNTSQYFVSYESFYNSVLTKYGKHLANLVSNKDYRTINVYDVETGGDVTTLNLFGFYPKDSSLPSLCNHTADSLKSYLDGLNVEDKYYILKILKLEDTIPLNVKDDVANVLHSYVIEMIPTKMIDLSTFKNITDFENNRNELIKSIDNVNFITKYARDVKIEKEKVTKNTYKLDGTTDEQRKVNFYSNYSNCIEHIKKNTEKMYSKLDTSINFLNIQFTFEIAEDIIRVLFYDDKTSMVGRIGATLPTPDNDLLDKITKKLNQSLYQPSEINIKFSKDPVRKNDKQIKIDLEPMGESPETEVSVDEIKKLFGLPNNVTDKLNYYRK